MTTMWNALGTSIVVFALLAAPAWAAEPSDPETLITVNGIAITSADLDALIMAHHQTMDMSATDEQLLLRLLEKAVNDELILQDATAMGLDQEPEVLEPVQKKRLDRAIALWVGETLEDPAPPTRAELEAVYGEEYQRLRIRQFSLRTREEAERVRSELVGGADWDAMAKVMSLDVHGVNGGLHNDKPWIDLEPALQEHAATLAPGQTSPVFAYRESWTMIRVESRTPADPAAFAEHEESLRSILLEEARKREWEEFVTGLRERTPARPDEKVLEAIRADGAEVYTGSFFEGTDRVALRLDEDEFVTENELRRAVSKQAMEMGTSPFEDILQRTLDLESRRLVLRHHAVAAGYVDRDEVVSAYEKDLREALINSYLNQTVVQRIRFDREEYQRVYDENKESFRGQDEVALSFLFLESEEQARTVADRLAKGADFDFVRKEIMGEGHAGEQAKWAGLDMFSEDIIEAASAMQPGGSSPPLAFRDKWMIFRLDGRRPGSIPPIESVDTQIRQVLFQKEFQEILDQHLTTLKANSEIVRHEDRIRRYFSSES